MANTKSAEKASRVSERNRVENRPVKSAVKSQISKTQKLIESHDLDGAKVAAAEAISAMDRAVKKGVIHPNNAARHKSRLARRLNESLATAKQTPASE